MENGDHLPQITGCLARGSLHLAELGKTLEPLSSPVADVCRCRLSEIPWKKKLNNTEHS